MKFSFRDRKKAFSFGKNFHLGGLRQLLLSDVQSFFHVQHIFSTHCCIQLHQICLFYMELRGQKPVCQFSIIGKDKKSFRILIKPAPSETDLLPKTALPLHPQNHRGARHPKPSLLSYPLWQTRFRQAYEKEDTGTAARRFFVLPSQ